MSAESRLLRGDKPEDVAKLFHLSLEDCKAILARSNKPAPKKKAARKKKA
jgi:hypothetical protein